MPRDESWREPWDAREGLITMGVLPGRVALQAILDSLPRITEARLLADRVTDGLGDRALHDIMAGEGNRLVFLRDADDPRLVLPEPFLALDLNVPPPSSLPMAPLDLPESMKPKPPPEPAEQDDEPAMLPGPDRYPGRIRISEGPAYIEISYGPNGLIRESVKTIGDPYSSGKEGEQPYRLDPQAKPAQIPPLGLLARADLDPEGHDLDALAGMVCELDPAAVLPGRVYMPVAQPGGIAGCWWRGYHGLRTALWDGAIGEEEHGWVAIDTWSGTVIAVAATPEQALSRWQEVVGRAVPLPPREPPPEPEPDLPDEPPSSQVDEENKTVRINTGTVRIAIVPRVMIDWPEVRPENVAAVLLPLPATREIPKGWESYGFTRRVRLVGEHGQVTTAFVRDEHAGFTMIGEGAIAALDPVTLDRELDPIDVERRREIEESGFWLRGNPYLNYEYPWCVPTYKVWDDTGRKAQLRDGGISWTATCLARDLDGDGLQWMVTRACRRDVAHDRVGANTS